jgi:hypothetical protein
VCDLEAIGAPSIGCQAAGKRSKAADGLLLRQEGSASQQTQYISVVR